MGTMEGMEGMRGGKGHMKGGMRGNMKHRQPNMMNKDASLAF